jgi:hypothetical protein
MNIALEHWDGTHIEQEAWPPLSCDDFAAYLGSLLTRKGSCVLEMMKDNGETLLIGIDRSELVVTFITNDQPFDLVGNPAKEGTRAFTLGGQTIEYPARLVLDLSAVVEVACAYLKNGSIDVSSNDWSPQGVVGW